MRAFKIIGFREGSYFFDENHRKAWGIKLGETLVYSHPDHSSDEDIRISENYGTYFLEAYVSGANTPLTISGCYCDEVHDAPEHPAAREILAHRPRWAVTAEPAHTYDSWRRLSPNLI